MKSTSEIFWSRVSISSGCWEYKTPRGGKRTDYPQMRYLGRYWQVNRLVWHLTYGDIPSGLFVCHHCDNPKCVRPDHLFLGTADDNNKDKAEKGRARSGGEKLRKLSDEQVIDALRRYNQGETAISLAKEYSINEKKLRKWLDRIGSKYGIKKKPKRAIVDPQQILVLKGKGMTRREIASHLGVSVWNIDRTLEETSQIGPEAHR